MGASWTFWKRLAFLTAAYALGLVRSFSAVVEWQVPAEDDHVASFRLFCPEAVATIRAVVVLVPGTDSDGRALADDQQWRALATRHQLALVGCYFKGKAGGTYVRAAQWSGAALDQALQALGEPAGHREISEVPLAFWGHSAGGEFGYNFACWKPERTLCFVANKGGYYSAEAGPAVWQVPALWVMGGDDTNTRRQNIVSHYEEGREHGAPWGLVREPATSHGLGRSRELGLAFFEDVLALRIAPSGVKHLSPSGAGWLAQPETGRIEKNPGPGAGPPEMAWFPGERTALLWHDIELQVPGG